MGVRFNYSKTFKTTVKFNTLTAEGKEEAQSFDAEFKRLTRDEVKALVDESANDAEMVQKVMVGWTMVDSETKEVTAFNDTNLATFISIPGAAGVTMLRFMETVGANRAKN